MNNSRQDARSITEKMAEARALTRRFLGKNSKASVDDFLAERRGKTEITSSHLSGNYVLGVKQ